MLDRDLIVGLDKDHNGVDQFEFVVGCADKSSASIWIRNEGQGLGYRGYTPMARVVVLAHKNALFRYSVIVLYVIVRTAGCFSSLNRWRSGMWSY